MTVWIVIAAAWLGTALAITTAFIGARRSPLLHRWLFGPRPTAEVHRLVVAQPATDADRPARLVA